MDDSYETKDIITATYLKVRGHYCIGTIPAGNKYKPQERLWMFANSAELQADVKEVRDGNPSVPIREVFYCSSILKNLLNDKDTL